jgi:outer membrane protein OmpA-like peptidoglycan-associated protein
MGYDDIYSFIYSPAPPPVPTQLILAVTTFERLENGTIIPLADVDVHYHTNAEGNPLSIEPYSNGVYYATIDCGTQYLVNGAKTGYFSTEKEIVTKCKTMNDTIFVELIFDKIIINKPIVIENIYYDFDKWNIRPDAAVELDKIVHLLLENPQIIIELGSHTDCRGNDKYNKDLSQKRAESAVQYIVDKGISKERITAKGYGESVLVNKCDDGVNCSEEEHQMNRRTEFKVTGFNKVQQVIYSGQE